MGKALEKMHKFDALQNCMYVEQIIRSNGVDSPFL